MSAAKQLVLRSTDDMRQIVQTLSDGSRVHNIEINCGGFAVRIACNNANHARELFGPLSDASWIEVTAQGGTL